MNKEKFNQEIIDAYEQFIMDVYEAMQFVKMGCEHKHDGVFDILQPIIRAHEKQMWEKIEKTMSK